MEGSSCELSQGCTNPGCLVMQEPKFCMVAPNIFSIIIAAPLPSSIHKKMWFTSHAPSTVPDNSVVHRSIQSCWVLSTEFASCHPSGACNLEMTLTLLQIYVDP
jgi:hypothetical protein